MTLTHFPRSHRALFVFITVCLTAIFAATVFVAARGGGSEPPEHGPAQTAASTAVDSNVKTRIAQRFGKLPLSFEINQGQIDPAVKFLSRGPGYDLFLTSTEAVLSLRKPRAADTDPRQVNPAEVREGSVLRLKMIGANANAQVEGRDELPGKVNYFTGDDPEKWRRNISTYRKAYYKGVYPGIDIVYYGNQRELEYDFVVAPGADPKLIKFRIDGADRIRIDETGSLMLALNHGEVRLNKPFIYQLNEKGSRSEVKGAYAIKGNEISFKLRGFDAGKPLVIDPILSYATFLGANGQEHALGIAVDSQGSAYVTGVTSSSTFPTTAGAFKTTSQSGGAFVTKLDPTGSSLVYSTFLSGTTSSSTGTSIAVDAAGIAYVAGHTSSTDFPTVNALKTTSNFFKTTDSASNWNNANTGLPGDVRAIAVAPNAPNTIYAGVPGGPYRSVDGGATWTKTPTTGLSGFPFANSMAVDPTNSAIVYLGPITGGLFRSTNGGNTWSTVNVPLNNAGVFSIVFDPMTPSTVYIASGAGVFKSVDSGTTWTPQNNFGLLNPPNVRSLAIDPITPATLYAGTAGSPGMFKSTNGGSVWTAMNSGMVNCNTVNAIVVDPFNAQTIYAGCGSFGSGSINKSVNGATSWSAVNDGVPSNFHITAMVADRTNASTVYAATAGSGVLKTTNGGTNWIKVNTGLWKTDIPALVAHPSNSSILFAGGGGNTFPDAFITKLNASGSGLLFSTLLGGSNEETGNGIAIDGSGNIYVVGQTTSPNFPAVNAIQSAPTATENCVNGFVTKINPAVPSYVFSTYLGGSSCDAANSVAVDQSANVYVTGNTNSNDFPLAAAFQSARGGPFNTDAFVAKLTSGGALTYSTYLGGDGTDTGQGIAVDASGNAHVTGLTTSNNFPTVNPIQPSNGGGAGDVYITKFNAQGSGLIYSTYLGAQDTDIGRGIALDPSGNAYVTGFTRSLGFPLVAGSLGTKSPLYKSVDGAANWNNENFGLPASIRTIAIHPTQQPGTVFAGTASGLFKSTNGGKQWTLITNGIPASDVRAIVYDSPFTMYAVVNDGGFSNPDIKGVYKSTDSGNSWTRRMTGLVHTSVLGLSINRLTPAILYAGTQGGPIYKTTNGGDSWSPTSSPANLGSPVVDPHTPTRVFAGDDFGSFIYRSIDSGATWQQIGAIDPGPQGRIAVSPHTPGLVYASGRNFNLFRSVDSGDNWTLVRSGAGTIVFDPVTPSTVYLASFNEGVLKSTNNGQTWTPMNKGLEHNFAIALAVDPLKPSTLYLASVPTGTDDDAFVTKISPTGGTLIYSTLVGGATAPDDPFNAADTAFAIAVDAAGNAYVTGLSRSGFQGTPNSYQPLNRGADDAFIAKLSMSHTISGRVKTSSNDPVSEAEVVLNDGTSIRSVFSESDGSYEFSHLREGGNFTVSATKPQFTITPASQSFNNLTSNQTFDFTAMMNDATFHTISGQITNNGVGLAGVTVTLSGSQSGLRTTDANGNYSFTLLLGGNYTVTPSILGFTFGTPSQTFNPLSSPQTANFTATRQNFVVTNTNNHGTGSLREAITNANATVGTDTIVFNIPGSGVKVINLLNVLPEIIDPVVIDGTTQPGYAGTPLIELDGFSIGTGSGLVIKAGGTTVRGLAVVRFRDMGILLDSCDNNVIQANHIGVNAAGTAGRANNSGIRLTNSNNNTIGGTTAAARNVISGNTFDGIDLGGSGNVIQGNYIGTNAAGTAAIPNGISGVSSSSAPSTNNLIGGTSPGAGNLISGNQRGVSLNGPGNTVQGNLIGTDHTGTNKVPNGTGVHSSFSVNSVIGGLTPGARNIISGNSGNGIYLAGSGTIQGNYIGTDITGTLPLGNEGTGVVAGNGPVGGTGVVIGGTTPEARNIIAANGGFGNVGLGENSSGSAATLQGNYIGTDVTGTKALGPNTQAGVAIFSNNNLVGGTVAGAQNVISGQRFGIQIGGFISSFPSGNVIQGNLIGLNAQGTGLLGNTQGGLQLAGAENNTIGGTQNGAGNKIAFNGGPGVHISSGTGNSIRGNSIFSNNGLGIDLGSTTGVTPNDATDPDTGPNNLQNFPVVTTFSSNASNTNIQGSLTSIPNTTFQIDFYSNAAVDPSGNGEGGLFFNTTSVTTDGNGVASFDINFPLALATGRVITATATDPNNNTSEFSAADASRASGSVQFSFNSFFVIEDVGMATVTVERTGGSSGPLSVEFATADITAIAGQDYTATSGTLNFANGETSKTIQVPILDDATTEPDETFTLTLKNASSLEALGAPSAMTITIQDKTTVPALLTFNASVTEGDAGTTTDARFEVRLSAATGRTVSVDYATANFNAHGDAACGTLGVDYQTASGTITFQPGTFSIVIPVKVCGDTSAELNEGFTLNLSKAINATIAQGQGLGTIINDDVIQLLHEESSPIVNQAAAVDSIFFVRDPFRIVSVPELFANGVDRNTRVILFVRNLQLNPGETSSAVVVRMIGSNNQIFEVLAEDFRAVPGFDFMQVVFRLPNNLPAGTCTVFIRSHGRISNLGTFRIVQ